MDDRLKIDITPWYWDALLFIAFVSVLGFALFHSLLVPPVLLEQGLSHRIFYFHVPVAWVALYGPFFASISAILYIIRKESIYDRWSESLNQISLLFAVGVLISGPIWAKSAWGVSWDWTDARLQSFFILVVSLVGYFLLRSMIPNPKKREWIGSYLTLLCAVNALLTWGAIRWFDNPGNHPGSVLGEGGMDPIMKTSFYWNVVGYHILFLLLIRITIRFQSLKSMSEVSKSLRDE